MNTNFNTQQNKLGFGMTYGRVARTLRNLPPKKAEQWLAKRAKTEATLPNSMRNELTTKHADAIGQSKTRSSIPAIQKEGQKLLDFLKQLSEKKK